MNKNINYGGNQYLAGTVLDLPDSAAHALLNRNRDKLSVYTEPVKKVEVEKPKRDLKEVDEAIERVKSESVKPESVKKSQKSKKEKKDFADAQSVAKAKKGLFGKRKR